MALVETLVDRATGTNIGNMTSGGGLAAAFDGNTNQAAGSCAQASGTPAAVGKQFGSAKTPSRVVVYGGNNNGFISGSNPSVTIQFRAGNSGPSNWDTDGALLGSITFTDATDESGGREIPATSNIASYTHWWCVIVDPTTGSTNRNFAEIEMYELL